MHRSENLDGERRARTFHANDASTESYGCLGQRRQRERQCDIQRGRQTAA